MIKNKLRYRVTYLVIAFLILFSMSFALLYLWEKNMQILQTDEIKSDEMALLSLESAYFQKEFSLAFSDLHYLNATYAQPLLEVDDYKAIEQDWVTFSTFKAYYDQIRYIDASGKEVINIKASPEGPMVLTESALENKEDRYYFSETSKLKKGGIYISQLDLSIEEKQIEMPYKPIIRFSTPLYDHTNTFHGIIVLNYSAENLLYGFGKIAENSNGEMAVLNSEGYWIPLKDADGRWRFDFEAYQENRFDALHLVDEHDKKTQQILNEEKLLSVYTMSFTDFFEASNALFFEEDRWYFLSQITPNEVNASIFKTSPLSFSKYILKTHALFFILIFIGSFAVALLMYVNRKTYEKMKYYSDYDPLTKTYNRHSGMTKLIKMFPLDERRQYAASLCFIDINGLKRVNDELGHKFGDELITTVAQIILLLIRDNDFIMRLGGDEFLIVFYDTDKDAAEAAWDRILEVFSNINIGEKRPYNISVSHGIVSFTHENKVPIDDLIKLADHEMYREKSLLKPMERILKDIT